MSWTGMLSVLAGGGSIVAAFVGRQLQSEFQDWTPKVTDKLTGSAADRLSKRDRERYREEWSAHLAETPGQIGKWWAAADFMRAARKMQPVNLKPDFIDRLITRTLKETFRIQLYRGLPLVEAEGSLGRLQSKLIQRGILRQLRRLLAEDGVILPRIKL